MKSLHETVLNTAFAIEADEELTEANIKSAVTDVANQNSRAAEAIGKNLAELKKKGRDASRNVVKEISKSLRSHSGFKDASLAGIGVELKGLEVSTKLSVDINATTRAEVKNVMDALVSMGFPKGNLKANGATITYTAEYKDLYSLA